MKIIYPNGRIIECENKTEQKLTVDELRAAFKGRWYSLLYAFTDEDGMDMFFAHEELSGLDTLPPLNKKASEIAGKEVYGKVLLVREVDIK